jgi:hypothetical protein
MGKFIAKLKGDLGFNKVFEKNEELKKIIDDNKVFFGLVAELGEAIDFKENPEHKLENGNFFYIDYSNSNEEIKSTIQSYSDAITSSSEISTLNKSNLENIDFLFYGKKIDEKIKLNLQSITPKYFIKSKSFLKFNSHIVYHHEKDVLEFKDNFDLHIDEKNQKIYFKEFAHLRKIHKDFIELYKEATEKEKDDFIQQINDSRLFSIDSDKLGLQPTNLKKLKYILDNKILEVVFKEQKKVDKYVKKYKTSISLRLKDGKYLVSNNKEFTDLLKIINENFYQGEITGKKLESNSTKVLK